MDACPCVCHTFVTGAGRLLAADCDCDCDAENRAAAVEAFEADCAALEEGDQAICKPTFEAPRNRADHTAPPCCHTPALCGGPHEDCSEAAGARDAAPEAEAGEHACDAPHPYCSLDDHADVPATAYRCDHVLPLCPGRGCGGTDGDGGGTG